MNLSLDAWAHKAGHRAETVEALRAWLGADAVRRRSRAEWAKLTTMFLNEPAGR